MRSGARSVCASAARAPFMLASVITATLSLNIAFATGLQYRSRFQTDPVQAGRTQHFRGVAASARAVHGRLSRGYSAFWRQQRDERQRHDERWRPPRLATFHLRPFARREARHMDSPSLQQASARVDKYDAQQEVVHTDSHAVQQELMQASDAVVGQQELALAPVSDSALAPVRAPAGSKAADIEPSTQPPSHSRQENSAADETSAAAEAGSSQSARAPVRSAGTASTADPGDAWSVPWPDGSSHTLEEVPEGELLAKEVACFVQVDR